MFNLKRKVLFGLSVSMVLAMAIGSFALGESQTPASPQEVEAQSAVGATVGPFTVNGGTQGTDYGYASSVLTIHSGNLTISTTAQTAERIVVDGAATITLAGVNIDRTSETEVAAPITITDNATFDVNILLADGSNNILKGNKEGAGSLSGGAPGIQKNGSVANIGTLTIGVPNGSSGTGKLQAIGGRYTASIGGSKGGSVSNITITGGEVTATGGADYSEDAAGIGGGQSGSASNITISGGVVTANGGMAGAGIGGGQSGSASDITISGGKVTATGGSSGAGIGGGNYGNGSNITISGGVVTATGSGDGAGIGDGFNSSTSGSGNSLNGDAVVLATSGSTSKAALEGFADSDLNRGITFTRQRTSGTWSGTMYGNSVKITEDVEFPADLTISANKQVTVGENTTLTIPENVTLTTESGARLTVANGATLKNDGTVIEGGTVVVSGTITTKTDFYLEDGSLYNTGYQTYRTNAGVQKYTNLPNPYQLDPSNGKRFINWYYLNQAGQKVAISENVNVLLNEHSFYENSVEQFTVTFIVPTGTAPAAQTIDDGSNATDPQLIWADGTVEGWYKEQSFTNKWNFNTDTVTGNITLYAKFQCTVTFNVPTGTAPQAQTVDIGSNATDPQLIWANGTVEGWYKENTYQNKWNFGTDTVTGNITLYAKFQCTVTFDPNYSGGSEVTSQTVAYDNTVSEPDEPTRDGYSFVEWCKDEQCTTAWDFENDRAQGDMTLYAKWLGNEHKVIIPSNPDDHGTVTTDSENPKTGDEVIITVTPEEGYEIDGLPIVKTEDGRIIEVVPTGNPNEYKFIMPDSDVTIEVHFVRISEPEVKTGDSFAGIAALAILGLATTGAVLVRKRK